MEVNCEALAVIGATLANGGVCPISLERVIKPDAVRDVLSLLHSCGFYEYSGQFAFKVPSLQENGAILGPMSNIMLIKLQSPVAKCG